ncbi:MAG TPA: PAS domain S-box protein [Acidimicrobiales bacterium]|nr:PAS domain S-box protein [Acidimicrobiales bacterium]
MTESTCLELLPEAALRVDSRGAVVEVNRLAEALFGPPPALAGVNGFLQWLAGAGDGVFRGRLHARRASGVPLTLALSARRLPDGQGAVCVVVEPDRERVAYEAQRHFDIAFDAAPIGMALFNTDGEYVRVNAALCALLGRTEAELLGRRDQEFTHPDDRQSDVDAAWRILRGEIDTWQCEKRFLRPDGSVVWALANLTFLRDEDGNPISWTGQFQDVSERKRNEKELEETLSLLAATLDATADGILVVNPDGRITSFNRRFTEMWRLPEEVVESGDAAALACVLGQLADRDAFLAKVEDLYDHPEAESLDVLHFVDGRVFERTSKPQRVGGQVVGRVWSFKDVTERHRLEADVAAALTQAQEASRLKSAFVATVSHEIRTPMNGVLGLSEMLLDSDLDATQRIQMLALRESGQSLLSLINDILDFSKIEAGKLDIEEADFDLCAAVRSVVGTVSAQAQAKGLDLRVDVDRDVPSWVRGDALRLRQVLVNLVGNAVKFTEAGSVTIGLSTLGGGGVRFRVADTGIGIEPAARRTLLDPFSQGDTSTTRRFGGTGLGLAICANLVELMHGTLAFDSTAGRGSTFWFDVPLPAAVPPSTSTATGPAIVASAAVPSGEPDSAAPAAHVLLADDARINQLVGVAMLERLGCTVDVVANGAEAVEAVLRNHYDVVLMDCLMPVMDGYEATARIRGAENGCRRTPIIALTASAMVGDRERCLAAGMDDYLAKPLDRSALAGVVARCRAAA